MNPKGKMTIYGLENIASLLVDEGYHLFYIALGSGTETTVAGLSEYDLVLDAEFYRVAATVALATYSVTSDAIDISYALTVTAALNGYEVGEIGIFDSAGRLWWRGCPCNTSSGLPEKITLVTGDVATYDIKLVNEQGSLV